MEMNNMQGVNAYTNPPGTTPQVDSTQLRAQNSAASKSDLNTENTNAAQQAFEVSITEDAKRLAAEAAEESAQTQTTTPEDQAAQNIVPAQVKSQIMNIVA